MAQIWVSRGYRDSSIMHENLSLSLKESQEEKMLQGRVFRGGSCTFCQVVPIAQWGCTSRLTQASFIIITLKLDRVLELWRALKAAAGRGKSAGKNGRSKAQSDNMPH